MQIARGLPSIPSSLALLFIYCAKEQNKNRTYGITRLVGKNHSTYRVALGCVFSTIRDMASSIGYGQGGGLIK